MIFLRRPVRDRFINQRRRVAVIGCQLWFEFFDKSIVIFKSFFFLTGCYILYLPSGIRKAALIAQSGLVIRLLRLPATYICN